jgi:hypothetical protein
MRSSRVHIVLSKTTKSRNSNVHQQGWHAGHFAPANRRPCCGIAGDRRPRSVEPAYTRAGERRVAAAVAKGKEEVMRKGITWVMSGCMILCLLVLAGDSLLFYGWSPLSAQPHPHKTDAMTSIINQSHLSATSFERVPGAHAAPVTGVLVVATVMARGADPRVAVQAATGSQPATSTRTMRVLGRDGRLIDRLAVRPGDILVWRSDTVQDESA